MASTDSRRSSSLVAAGILLSRVFGLVRGRVFAHYFGTGAIADAFNAALRIPNLLQNLLGEGVLSGSFIPVYARLVEDRDQEEAGALAGAIAGLLAVLSGVLVIVGVLLAGPITDLLALGFSGLRRDLTESLVRIMFPGMGLLVLSAWCLGILNSHRQFFLSYVAPVLWNLAQIIALIAFGLRGTTGDDLAIVLGWSVVAGSALQFAVQLPAVLRLVPSLRLSVDRGRSSVRKVLAAFLPIVTGRGVVQLMAYVDLAIASFLAIGAVSALGYAQTLYLLPVGLFGMAVAAAELPELSRAKPGELDVVGDRLENGLARIAFFVVGSVLVFVLLGDLLIGTLFGSGQFGTDDIKLVWLVLIGYSLGLIGTTSSRLYQSVLYGMGEAKLPARAAAVRVTFSAILGLLLMLQLDRIVIDASGALGSTGGLPAFTPLPAQIRENPLLPKHLGAVGLAVAAGLSAWIETWILRRRLRVDLGRDVPPGGGHLARSLGAAAVAVPVALVARLLVADLPALIALGLAVGATGVTYVATASALGVPEAAHFVAMVRRRLPARADAPEHEPSDD
ncbi:MAG: putative peptidoglycan lipid II flippase [Glaciecola sp.]